MALLRWLAPRWRRRRRRREVVPASAPAAGAGPAAAPPPAAPRGLILLLGGAAAVVTIGGLKAFAGILAPTLLALMLTIAVSPLVGAIARTRVPGWVASVAGLAAVYVILISLVTALVVAGAQLAGLLPGYADEFGGLVQDVRRALAGAGIEDEEIRTLVGQLDLGRLVSSLEGVLGGALGVLSDLIFVLALLVFMSMDAAGFPRRLRALPEQRSSVVTALTVFARGTRRYFVVSSVFGLVVAVFDTIALALLGVPLPVLWGVLSFVTNYVPNIGFVLGVIPPALLALLDGGPGLMLAVIVIYSAVNFVIQSLIQPKFVGDSVGLSSTITFLSLVFWTWVLGPLGALLAVPLTLLAKALLVDIDPATRWLNLLISNRAPLDRAPQDRAPQDRAPQDRAPLDRPPAGPAEQGPAGG